MSVKIRIEYSADSISADVELTPGQVLEYGESLARYVATDYPNADLNVSCGISNKVVVYAGGNLAVEMETEADIQQSICDHWQTWIDEVAMQ